MNDKPVDPYWLPLNINRSAPKKPEEDQPLNSSANDGGSSMENWKNQSTKRKWLGSGSDNKAASQTEDNEGGGLSPGGGPRASIRSTSGLPMATLGEIEFSGLNQTAKFARLYDTTPEEKIRETLIHKWDMRRPTLIISIFGADFEKKRKLKVIFKKGLWKAAESAGCWIITGGFNLGVNKLAGEAVRDYTDAYGGNNMIAIGVNSWGCVSRNDVLESSNYETGPAIYQTEEDAPATSPAEEAESEETPNTSEEEKRLDPNHTHFLLVDTGKSRLKGEEAEFRAKFESIISVWHDEDGDVTVPMCGLVVGGDRFNLKQVFMGLTHNGCPVVVAKGTGGAADALADSINIANQHIPDDSEEGEEDVLGTKIEAALRESFFEIHPDVYEYSTEVGMIKEILESRSHLVAVFDMEEDFDLDGFLISSLLSSAGSHFQADQLNLEQLKIGLTLNRPDIAREKIFLDNKKYKKGDLNDYMYQALMQDRHEFVKLFLEQGFSLEEFLTVYTLEKLYTDQLKRLNSKVAIFHQLWEYHRSHRSSKKVSLREVGKVIRVLVGDFYHPLYLYKEFQKKLVDQKVPQSLTFKAMIQSTQTTLAPAYHLCKTSPMQMTNSVVPCTAVDTGSVFSEPKLFSDIQFIDEDDHDSSPLRGSNSGQGIDNEITIESESAFNLASGHTKSQEVGVFMDENRRPRRKSSLDFVNSLHNNALLSGQFQKPQPDEPGNSSWLMSNIANMFNRRTEDDRAKYVQLDRPARELMLWSILVGKLQMAELFWSMEKEPIAGALLASMLLTSLETRTDDFTDKEDFLNYARHFEDQAEGVLDECYREDEQRAQHLIDRELYYYGMSSVILLSAEGESIRFMAHPCCQDFLNSTWMGKLSPKNSLARIGFGALCGLCMPFIIPKIVLFKMKEPTKSDNPKEKAVDGGTVEMNEIGGGDVQFYPGQENQAQKRGVERSDKLNMRQYVGRIRDFYMSPIMRFLYNTLSYLLFLIIYSYFILENFDVNINWVEGIVIVWITTLLLEEAKQISQATLSGISFSTYISDGWNKLDCAAIGLYVAGFILRSVSSAEFAEQYMKGSIPQMQGFILTDDKFVVARVFFAISLFLFYVRLMYIFSFHIALGPKLIMIGKMVVNDLVPFMVILLVFVVGYAVASHSISYPNRLYSPVIRVQNLTTMTRLKTISDPLIYLKLITKPYYQMFGDFGLDDLRGDGGDCSKDEQCPHWTSRWLIPVLLGVYVLLTNILMFNLLIAMFSQTYESVEKSSTHYWNYQRYQMISEYVDRSPLAPPLIIFWHFYELFRYIRINCFKAIDEDDDSPFCKSYKSNRKKERELMKWEHLKAMDFLRNQNEPQRKGRSGQSGGAQTRVISRVSGGQGPGQANAQGDLQKQMSDITEALNMELERKFKDIEAHFQRFNDMETRLHNLGDSVSSFSQLITNLTTAQENLTRLVNKVPLCQCAELMQSGSDETDRGRSPARTSPRPARRVSEVAPPSPEKETQQRAAPPSPRLALPPSGSEHDGSDTEAESRQSKRKPNQLEEAIRRVVESVYQSQPSWIEEATKNAAQSVLEQVQLQQPPPIPVIPSPSIQSLASAADRIVVEPERQKTPTPPPSVNLEEEWAATVEEDDFVAPEVSTVNVGRIIERSLNAHRLFRIAPFNFEKYAGMRMNVPPEKTPWPTDYPDYYAYDASDEVLEFANPDAFDNEEIDVRSITFNQYDIKYSLRRQSMLGRYRIDTKTGLPLNPMGRTGLRARGLLPRWGPNHAIILIVTRWHRLEDGKIHQRNGRNILQYVALARNKQYCIPWFLTDHLPRCDLESCVLNVASTFIQNRLRSLCDVKTAYQNFQTIEKATTEQVFRGYLDDHLNADNAWIESVVVNYHENDAFPFTDAMLDVFKEPNLEEQVRWLEVSYSTALRSSHSDLIKTVAQMRNAYF